MITNFEDLTQELTYEEKRLIHVLIKGFSNHGPEDPIKEPQIIKILKGKGYKISGVRLRKLVNHIRCKSMIPLIATNKGYFVTHNKAEIRKQIKSLTERADAINQAAAGLRNFL